jgi:hypothetical protein
MLGEWPIKNMRLSEIPETQSDSDDSSDKTSNNVGSDN